VCFATLPRVNVTLSGTINTDSESAVPGAHAAGRPDFCARSRRHDHESAQPEPRPRPPSARARPPSSSSSCRRVETRRARAMGRSARAPTSPPCAGKTVTRAAAATAAGGEGGLGGAMGESARPAAMLSLAQGGAMGAAGDPQRDPWRMRGGPRRERRSEQRPARAQLGRWDRAARQRGPASRSRQEARSTHRGAGAPDHSQGADDGAVRRWWIRWPESFLDAPMIVNNGIVTANGGGGGAADTSVPGSPATTARPRAIRRLQPAGLGEGGGSRLVRATAGPRRRWRRVAAHRRRRRPGGNAGGGGGGAVGVIWVKGTLTGTRFSPAPQQN